MCGPKSKLIVRNKSQAIPVHTGVQASRKICMDIRNTVWNCMRPSNVDSQTGYISFKLEIVEVEIKRYARKNKARLRDITNIEVIQFWSWETQLMRDSSEENRKIQ